MTDPHAEVLKKHPNLKEFLPLLDAHNAESSRGKVLVCCAFLEEQLRTIIDAFLISSSKKDKLLEGFNAPIGTFSARIVAAHCLGLISDSERDDCDNLRKIRNEFAHKHLADFSDKRIASLCANLHFSVKPLEEGQTIEPDSQFSSAAIALILSLINRPHYVGRARLAKRDWPY